MKQSIIAAWVCLALCLMLMALALTRTEVEADYTPEVNADGLCEQTIIEPEPLYTDDDVTALAQMLWGEARGCAALNQQQCVWCVLNRVDDERFPDSIIGVVSQSGQFHGYRPYYPATDELKAVAVDVLERWSAEKQGVAVERELDKDMLWFTGNGIENVFRREY